MWAYLEHLAVQQSTAPELATFLLLVIVVCLLVSALIYGTIMTTAWAVALRRRHSWREVVFPDWPHLRRFKIEYALAGLTSLVLALTLLEKDELVDKVLTVTATAQWLDSPLVAGLYPLDRLPDSGELGGVSFRDEVLRQSDTVLKQGVVKLGELVRGPLEAGRDGPVRVLFDSLARQVLARHPALHERLTGWLIGACIGLILAYLLWLTRGRIRELGQAQANPESPFKDVGGRLAVLGTCLGLLLATPAVADDPDLLADTAVDVARRLPERPALRRLDSLATVGIRRQGAALASGMRDTLAQRLLMQLNGRSEDLAGRLDSLRDAVTQSHAAFDALLAELRGRGDRAVDSLGRVVNEGLRQLSLRLDNLPDLGPRLDALERDLALERRARQTDSLMLGRLGGLIQSLHNVGLLLVETDDGEPFVVQGASARAASTSLGLFWLPPGTYRITTMRSQQSDTVTLARGAATARVLKLRIP